MANNTRKLAVGTLIAGLLGYLAGILTAPKSGKDTRKSIAKARDKAVVQAEKELKLLHAELNNLMDQANDKAKKARKLKDKTSDVLEGEIVERAGAVRQKTRGILSALRDGNIDDRDLNKAIDQAGKAIRSLQKYLKK